MAKEGMRQEPTNTALSGVTAIVVHHKRHSTVGDVVKGLLDSGVLASQILLVDNSEMPSELAVLAERLPLGVCVLETENRGYGAAVNEALASLRGSRRATKFTLVVTHEVAFAESAIAHMLEALHKDDSLVAVGPTLVSSLNPEHGTARVWSHGGGISGFLGKPFHQTVPVSSAQAHTAVRRKWLDGSAVLYRTAALPDRPFDESFFMYMEEVDLHLRLAHAGGAIAWVPLAFASQQSDGTPPFYYSRNIRLLQRRHGGRLGSLRAIVSVIRRSLGHFARREWASLRESIRGAASPLPPTDDRVIVVNPLGAALSHYTGELVDDLQKSGRRVHVISILEPSASGKSAAVWLRDYVRSLMRAKWLVRSMGSRLVIVVWPVLGYLDALLIRAVVGAGSLVIHDPVPLVRGRGYGRLSRWSVRLVSSRISFIAHSESAMKEILPVISQSGVSVRLLSHPVLTETSIRSRPAEASIVVLGQFKGVRDTVLMQSIGDAAHPEWRLTVRGKGWPSIPGWSVVPGYLSEEEFDSAIRDASVILIPYRRFFQSGVAIRAMENGVPVVGPRDSSLSSLFGRNSANLADDELETWLAAIEHALAMPGLEMMKLQRAYVDQVLREWSEFLSESM